jgi:hypothetical protein
MSAIGLSAYSFWRAWVTIRNSRDGAEKRGRASRRPQGPGKAVWGFPCLVILCPKSAGTPTCCWLPQLSTIASIETRARLAAKATERNLLLTIRSFVYIPLQIFSRGMILPAPHKLPGSPATVVFLTRRGGGVGISRSVRTRRIRPVRSLASALREGSSKQVDPAVQRRAVDPTTTLAVVRFPGRT